MVRNFELSDAEYADLCALVRRHTGISLTDEKRKLVYSRFSKRLRALHLNSFREYCDLIRDNHREELVNFTNAITTNLTSFFRESHHFDRLKEEIMPELLKKQSKKIRLWSAGCSTGEEPYSIAISILQCCPNYSNWDIKILATDLDSQVLSTAAAGIYSPERLEGLDKNIIEKWFKKIIFNGAPAYQVKPEARGLISFKKLNLMDNEWPMHGPFDVIFCRNVLIYFDKPTQQKLFKQFANLQNEGDHLLIGHSEIVKGMSTQYENQGRTSYTRV